jgi:hypothetical protein
MLARLNTFALVGIDAMPVIAEVDAAVGLPKTVLVGTINPIIARATPMTTALPLLALLLAGPGGPPPQRERVEVTHDLAGLGLAGASALQGGRHRFRVVRDSDADEVGGCVWFDCDGPDDVHRSVRFRKGHGGDGGKDEYLVEASVRILWHQGWGPFDGFAEVRLVDATETD